MFLHQLALEMGCTVSELSCRLTTDELTRWYAIKKMGPIGYERFDYLFAQLCQIVCMAAGAKKKGGGEFSLEDFMMFKRKKEMSPVDLMRGLLGGRVIKGKPKRTKR